MATTTITEIALKKNIPYIYLFRLVKKARIKPVINKKIQINGYLGIPYKKNDLKDVVGLCKNKTFEKKKRGEKQITTINVSESIKKSTKKKYAWFLEKTISIIYGTRL